jgi:hypothetical protein
MKYTPYTEAQIQSMNVMEPGIYNFQVLEVITWDQYGKELKDKNGNDMAKIKLAITDAEYRERPLFTYITGDGAFAYKLRHFARSIGMIQQYEEAVFNIAETVGKRGLADIVIKRGTFKLDGSGEMWPDRNDVKDFITNADGNPVNHAHASSPPQVPNVEEDDTPF